MSLYIDPTTPGRKRPDLFDELLGQPSHSKQQQLENQSSYILGWLCDRSPNLARRLAAMFLDNDVAVTGAATIGARTQIRLPKPGGGALRPDLSIEGSDRSFQLLVEVKTSASFAEYLGADGETQLQHVHYRELWEKLPIEPEARVRAVGTLTAKADAVTQALPDRVNLGRLEARDVSWAEVHDLLSQLEAERALEPSTVLVASSFKRAVKNHLITVPLDMLVVAKFLDSARPIVVEFARALARRLGATVSGGNAAADFVNRYVKYTDPTGRPMVLRVLATPAGGVLCPKGEGDSLLVAVGRDEYGSMHGPDQFKARVFGIPTLKTGKFVLTCRRWDYKEAAQRSATDLADELTPALIALTSRYEQASPS